MKNRNLTVEVADEELLIHLGIDTLKTAIESSPSLKEEYGEIIVKDPLAWAKTIKDYLLSEEYFIKSSPVENMLDCIFVDALEEGVIKVIELKEEGNEWGKRSAVY
jgi:hypothetical protein